MWHYDEDVDDDENVLSQKNCFSFTSSHSMTLKHRCNGF